MDSRTQKSDNFQRNFLILLYQIRIEGASSQVMTTIHSGKKAKEVILKPNEIKVEGQTSGEWISAGKHTLQKVRGPSVEISTKRADGIVIADAVLFIPLMK